VALAGARMQAALAAAVRDDPAVRELLEAVVARRLDPASAARAILAGGDGGSRGVRHLDLKFDTANVEGDS
jgi:hypothetical protein